MRRKTTKLIHEGRYAAEVDIELLYDDTGWSPYLTPEEVEKLEAVRFALRSGDLSTAAKIARIFELRPISVHAAE